MSLNNQITALSSKIRALEERLSSMGNNMQGVVQSEFKRRFRVDLQNPMEFGVYRALCVSTEDPKKQNRIRYYCPLFHDSQTPVEALPFAECGTIGAFDGCGISWVPPAGSTILIVFEAGFRQTAFYIGTTWHRDRGPNGEHNWGYNIEEYYKVSEKGGEGRKGYLVGPNDGSQVLPPWSNESYNGIDPDSDTDFDETPDAQKKTSPPHIYGMRTPEDHSVKLDDGNPKCGRKGKSLQILSGGGGWIYIKDDPYHDAMTFGHTSCGSSGPNTADCTDDNGDPTERFNCEGKRSNSSILGGHPSNGSTTQSGQNPYFKHAHECRPYKGPGTPKNNRINLPQLGMQLASHAGGTLVFNDQVEEPGGQDCSRENCLSGFSFGCTDKFLGHVTLSSPFGKKLILNEKEDVSGIPGRESYVRLESLTGCFVELNDHTIGQEGSTGCPPNIGGSERGVKIGSSAGHEFRMADPGNEQCNPKRMDGGIPTPKAKNAFCRLKTGYGLMWEMNDGSTQEETTNQFIQIRAPQKDNEERGPHEIFIQEQKSGPGTFYMRAGGNFITQSYDFSVDIVGDRENNPASKVLDVSDKYIVDVDDLYFNHSDIAVILAEQYIFLLAGKDCENADGEPGPCAYPAIVGKDAWVCPLFGTVHWTEKAMSDKVFISAAKSGE